MSNSCQTLAVAQDFSRGSEHVPRLRWRAQLISDVHQQGHGPRIAAFGAAGGEASDACRFSPAYVSTSRGSQ